METEDNPRVKAALARAEALTPEKRSEIAKQAAKERWAPTIPTATHPGELHIAGIDIPCAVLNDGTRVLWDKGLTGAFGKRNRLRRAITEEGTRLPSIFNAKNVNPYISDELAGVLSKPIRYRSGTGKIAEGFPATVLPDICDVWLRAKKDGVLTPLQEHIAERAYILMNGFAKVGIIALVDEATGYQEVREKQALQAILDAYLRKELAAWAKRFPDEFYEHIFRLRGWKWKGRSKNPPQAVAGYTKDIVYARLAPHIIEELENRNPIQNGHRKAKHHQWLTDDVGHPALAQHLHAVITLMRVSKTWPQFKLMLDMAHPRKGDTLQLPLMADIIPDLSEGERNPNEPLPLFGRSGDVAS